MTKMYLSDLKTRRVPRSRHSLPGLSNKLMLYSEIIAVCSEIHTQHMNIMCGQNAELLSVEADGT